jgi:hypothetical protein
MADTTGTGITVTLLPAPTAIPRVETGVVQFGTDWPGVFIRGDSAFNYASNLRMAATMLDDGDFFVKHTIENLADLLGSCIVGGMPK